MLKKKKQKKNTNLDKQEQGFVIFQDSNNASSFKKKNLKHFSFLNSPIS